MDRNNSAIILVEHPLVAAKLSILRERGTAPAIFRQTLQEMAILLLTEVSKGWKTSSIQVETPLMQTQGRILSKPVVLVPVLRAGLGMVEGMLRLVPEARIGHIGIYRDETTLRPVKYFSRLPHTLDDAQVVLVDPMLATGFTACEAASALKAAGAKEIHLVCLVACPPGILQFHSIHSDIAIFTAAIDPELNDLGYIVPGLGDAGDRYFGTDK